MKYFYIAICAASLFCSAASAEVITKELTYAAGDTELQGYIAYDDSVADTRPGILVVHEWWGHNDYARKRARMLAGLGYTALAIDMYGEGKTASHPDDAGTFAGEVMNQLDVAKARIDAALATLKEHPSVDEGNIGAIGYCFGGGVVLHMARWGYDLQGVVSFHGSLAPKEKAKPGDIKAEILVCHGAADTFVSDETILDFIQEIRDAGGALTFCIYPDAKHSFTNPEADEYAAEFNLPLAYSESADAASWQDMQDFFQQVFND